MKVNKYFPSMFSVLRNEWSETWNFFPTPLLLLLCSRRARKPKIWSYNSTRWQSFFYLWHRVSILCIFMILLTRELGWEKTRLPLPPRATPRHTAIDTNDFQCRGALLIATECLLFYYDNKKKSDNGKHFPLIDSRAAIFYPPEFPSLKEN